jgi:hypothetical protein
MSESLAIGSAAARPDSAAEAARVMALDSRRKLQLGLGVIWLLDGILQLQPFMFGRGFPQMLAGNASGNPAFVAGPITWSAGFIDHHLAVLNAAFAAIQVGLGIGIAWRPTVRLALGASALWALGVWWFGEGLGGVLAGSASPVNGALAEGLGGIFTGSGTDPNTGPLLALLALAFWPAASARAMTAAET